MGPLRTIWVKKASFTYYFDLNLYPAGYTFILETAGLSDFEFLVKIKNLEKITWVSDEPHLVRNLPNFFPGWFIKEIETMFPPSFYRYIKFKSTYKTKVWK